MTLAIVASVVAALAWLGVTILISERTDNIVKDEFVCHRMPGAPRRGKSKDLNFFEVVSRKAAAAVV
jgi:hypothetical protein